MKSLCLFGFGLPGGQELWLLLLLAVLLFGAKKIPELARGLGRSIGEFRKAKEEFEREIEKSAEELELKKEKEKVASLPKPEGTVAKSEEIKGE
jgi:sec-independent protein translocase protein TatA